MNKLLQHDYTYETAFLATLLDAPQWNIKEITEAINKLEAKNFLNPNNRKMFVYVVNCIAHNKPFDEIVAQNELGLDDKDFFELRREYSYSPKNIVYLATETLNTYKLNKRKELTQEYYWFLQTQYVKSDELEHYENYLSKLYALDDQTTTNRGLKNSAEIVQHVNEIHEKGGSFIVQKTSDDDFNKLCGGGILLPTINVIYGQSGTGKTSFACKLFADLTLKQDKNCIFFTHEMTCDSIFKRCAAYHYQCSTKKITPDSSIDMQFDMLNKNTMYIFDDTKATIEKIYLTVKSVVNVKPVTAVFIDYLSIIKTNEKFYNLFERIDYIMEKSADIAKEFNCAVFMLAQLNRSASSKERPTMTDLKGSSGIENIADCMFQLHRDKDKSGDFKDDYIELNATKMRHYQPGTMYYKMGEGFYVETNQFAAKSYKNRDINKKENAKKAMTEY